MFRDPLFRHPLLLVVLLLAAAIAYDLHQLFGGYTCPACRQRARHGRRHACDWTAASV